MYSEAVIEGRDLSKVYLLYSRPEDRFWQMVVPRLKRMLAPVAGGVWPQLRSDRSRYHEFWALKGVSLRLKAHETLGIIGQNGSGKSTLLQIICGTLAPTTGEVVRKGRVAALLELGAGFNPEFTGRENARLNAGIYGLRAAEIDSRMQAIIDFAEIGEHIDQPVKTYSSGMFVRLAFSVIANIDADVLVIDEALAVGDAYFQQKCMRFLRKFQERGSIFFVSHDTGAMMSFCDRVIWLHHGEVRAEGNPKEVCEQYLAFLYREHTGAENGAREVTLADEGGTQLDAGLQEREGSQVSRSHADGRGFGDMRAEICSFTLCVVGGEDVGVVYGGELLELSVRFRAHVELRSIIVGFIFKDRLGQYIFGDNTFAATAEEPPSLHAGEAAVARFCFVMPFLAPGTYAIALSIASGTTSDHVQHHWLHEAIVVKVQTDITTGVMIRIPMTSVGIFPEGKSRPGQ